MAQRAKKNKLTPYPCPVCLKECRDNHSSICCDLCQSWLHAACIEMPESLLLYYASDGIDVPFYCRRCACRPDGRCVIVITSLHHHQHHHARYIAQRRRSVISTVDIIMSHFARIVEGWHMSLCRGGFRHAQLVRPKRGPHKRTGSIDREFEFYEFLFIFEI